MSIEILDKMRAGVAYRHPVTVRSFSVLVRPLTMMETNQVAETVNTILSGMTDAAKTRLQESTLLARETLKLATKDDVDSKQEPVLNDYVLDRMSPDEVHSLYKQWGDICQKVSPVLETLPKEEIAALVKELKKNPSQATELSFSQLVAVVQHLSTNDG
jgi:hypothetical protein